jgi:DtxR family Mn-dependent transcriptional regulator
MLNYSTSEENYIKAIFHLQGDEAMVTTNELARELKTKPASVTDMMKKLKTKKLLHYQPYQGFRLSPDGSKVALGIIRRHRLWEYFLSEKLKFNWDEVHEVAEHLEHVSSKKLIDKLDEYLDFPRVDPHGDPIPDMNGKIKFSPQVSLAEWALNKTAVVCHVSDQSSEMLELLNHKKIKIGTRLEVKKKFEYDNSLEICTASPGKISKQTVFNISGQFAKNIFVISPSPH